MDNNTSKKFLTELRPQVISLPYSDYDKIDAIRKKLELYIEKIFGQLSRYKDILKKISLSPTISFGGMSESIYVSSWESGKNKIVNLIDTMLEDLELSELDSANKNKISSSSIVQNNNIFIVHGHNEEMKASVARVLDKLSLSPVILHEQANKGRTIIEKFSDHSEVGFAVVLLSADDFGYSINQKPDEGKLRARQNVILELGYFIGQLGRERVVALVETAENFEFPSDYQGVIYIPYDKDGTWRFLLLKELKACDYNVDANEIL
ncbi:MAG: nucleotide-binding protein [Bacteroidota bacterium]